uniref:Rho-GAP domain-containing protein n=1 Tax=Chelydra serpentina TaxID=8475 RepID=A0A8C3XUV4_CHESE
DLRRKKLPLMALSITMAESFKELDTDSSLGRALEMSCFIQSMLAKVLSEFEITLESDVLQPLNKLSEEELPVILKHKKNLQKLISDWNSIKSSYANYFIKLLEIQAQYHRKSLESLDTVLAELKETHGQAESPFPLDTPVSGYYGVPLETHLRTLGREIALPIEACVMMLLASGMREEVGGLFRLAAGASVLRKLKCSLASGSNALEEFYSDPHAVAGALKSYLRELPQPLMTFELYDDWFKVACFKEQEGRLQSLQDTCSQLPQDNYNNLRYLIRFLAKLAEHQEVNKMTPTNIAIVLGPNLLWSQQSKGDPLQLDMASVSSIQVVGIVEALIQNADTLFPGGKALLAPTSWVLRGWSTHGEKLVGALHPPANPRPPRTHGKLTGTGRRCGAPPPTLGNVASVSGAGPATSPDVGGGAPQRHPVSGARPGVGGGAPPPTPSDGTHGWNRKSAPVAGR